MVGSIQIVCRSKLFFLNSKTQKIQNFILLKIDNFYLKQEIFVLQMYHFDDFRAEGNIKIDFFLIFNKIAIVEFFLQHCRINKQ